MWRLSSRSHRRTLKLLELQSEQQIICFEVYYRYFVIMSGQVSEMAWSLYEYLPSLSDVQSMVTAGALVSSDLVRLVTDCLLRTVLATWSWLASINWRYWTNTILQTGRVCLEEASKADPLYILILGIFIICKHLNCCPTNKLSPPPWEIQFCLNAFQFTPQCCFSPQQ